MKKRYIPGYLAILCFMLALGWLGSFECERIGLLEAALHAAVWGAAGFALLAVAVQAERRAQHGCKTRVLRDSPRRRAV